MPQFFSGYVVLRGNNAKTTRINYDLGEFTAATPGDEYEAAVSAITQIVGALDTITDAEIAEYGLGAALADSGAVPGDGVNVFEVAAVSCYVSAPAEVPKFATVNVPAPVDGIFMAASGEGKDIVDVTDAALQQYVQQLSEHAFVSDGEQINITNPNGGVRRGRRITRNIPSPFA